MTTAEAPTLPEGVRMGLSSGVKYLVTNLLKDEHYSKISGSLATQWNKFQTVTAAMKLMEQHGVHVPPEEVERLSTLTEPQVIESLVSKMPQQSKEQFQHFFLQLQLIVSTATRVRSGLEQGRSDVVEQAMDDAESTGIAQYILKMAIVQAGSEVNSLKKQHTSFVKDAEGKMSRLSHGAEEMMVAKERLKKVNDELAMFNAAANEGIKKVLMALAGGTATALLHSCFSSWGLHTKKMKQENLIFEEYREELEAAEQNLIDAKAGQLKSVKGMIEKRHAGTQESLMNEVLTAWKNDIFSAKLEMEALAKVKAMEEKLKNCADQQSANAKKVLARCGAASAQGMRDMCFHEWINFHRDYLKNKELEDKVKEEEKRIAEFMKTHSQNAQGLLNNMHAATESGLKHEVFEAWAEIYKQEKQINEFAEKLNGGNAKFGAFGDRNKKGAKSVMERAHEHNMTMLYLQVWGAWKLDTTIEKRMKVHQGRIDGKRQQLIGVQKMFRDFAKQLESNIQSGADSQRDLAAGPPPKGRKSSKTDGTVSLPQIDGNAA